MRIHNYLADKLNFKLILLQNIGLGAGQASKKYHIRRGQIDFSPSRIQEFCALPMNNHTFALSAEFRRNS